jgi:DnaJ-class molecular chaperone
LNSFLNLILESEYMAFKESIVKTKCSKCNGDNEIKHNKISQKTNPPGNTSETEWREAQTTEMGYPPF